MDDLLREFVGETLDMMESVAGDLVAWEGDPNDRSGLDRIFRTIHTAKGSSGFFDLPRITGVAHAAEELLDALRARRREPDRETVAMVLAAFDRIRDLTRAIAETGVEPAGDDSELIERLFSDVRDEDVRLPYDGPERRAEPRAPTDLLDANLSGEVPLAWRSVRVPVGLLDELMSGVSDLVLARNEVAAQLRTVGVDPSAVTAFERLSGLLGTVRGSVSQMRMVPLRHLFAPLPRLVRQIADELGKQVTLTITGGEVEIDREVIESLRDPMVHVLRNAIDHGIEMPAARRALGKPESGTLHVAARQTGNRILITFHDDGAGLSLDALVRRAEASGHLTAEVAASLSPQARAELVFLPGLSTAASVTEISGRGVGMDVVKANVERLGGAVKLDNRPGRGLSLTFDVPMTLTIISALAIDIAGQGFAIPRSAVDEVMLASNDAIQRQQAGGAGLVRVRGELLPCLVLEDALGIARDESIDELERAFILCHAGASRRIVLDVPDVRDHEELVIKPLPPILMAVGMYNGLSLPDNGQPMLVLDIAGLWQRAALPEEALPLPGEVAVPVAVDNRVSEPWLSYEPYDGFGMAAVAMAAVERISDIPVDRISFAGGRWLARFEDRLLTIVGGAFKPPAEGVVRMIRLGDGLRSALLPVREISHLLDLAVEMVPAHDDSPLLGVAMFDDVAIEMIDSYRLLAGIDSRDEGRAQRYLWIVDDSGGSWSERFLVPSITAAGYQVSIVPHRDDVLGAGAMVLTVAQDAAGTSEILVENNGDGLSAEPTALSPYDRSGLLAAIAARATVAPDRKRRAGRKEASR